MSQLKGFEELKVAFLLGIGAHKLPEGLALGALLAAALGTARKAMLGAAAAQLTDQQDVAPAINLPIIRPNYW